MGRMGAALAATIGLGLLAGPAPAQIASPAAPQTTHADWVAKPSGDDMAEAYPPLASAIGVTGHVMLHCRIATTGRTEDCQVVSEAPKGFGFGDAALKVAPLFRMAPSTSDGSAVASDVRIPIRFALPSSGEGMGEAWPALVLAAGLLLALLALAVNDQLRGGRAPRMPVGAATAYSLRFVARTWRRIPGPMAAYLALLAGMSLWPPLSDAPPPLRLALSALSFILGLMITGSGLRLGFSEVRAGDRGDRLGPLGFGFGRVELRVLASDLVGGLLIASGIAALAIAAVILMLAVRTFVANETLQSLAAVVLMTAGAAGIAYGALRLWTFTPAAVFRKGLPLREAWTATRAAVFSPLAAGLLIVLVAVLAALGPAVFAAVANQVWKTDLNTYAGVACGMIVMAIVQPALVGLQVFAFRTLHLSEEA